VSQAACGSILWRASRGDGRTLWRMLSSGAAADCFENQAEIGCRDSARFAMDEARMPGST
jgi:hypothetical protein